MMGPINSLIWFALIQFKYIRFNSYQFNLIPSVLQQRSPIYFLSWFSAAADVLPLSSSSTSMTSNIVLRYLRDNSCFIIGFPATFGGLYTPVLGWFVGGFSGVWWLVGFWFSLANWTNWVKLSCQIPNSYKV